MGASSDFKKKRDQSSFLAPAVFQAPLVQNN
jgi:hypothetical protein